MIAPKTLKLSLKSLKDFAKRRLPDEKLLELDVKDECPLDIVRFMCDPDQLAIQLLFIPEEYGGMGGGAFDVYCICEEMARIDLGIATGVLATFLGSDPITVGATPEQKKLWLSRIADEGLLFAYGATEPEAGSDLPSLKTTADQRRETVDQQWRSSRCVHGAGECAGRSNLVRRGERHEGVHSRRARGEAWHSIEQYRCPCIQ
jgi:alkylation response protein AidB-like acyl-CoA dehydrogenase